MSHTSSQLSMNTSGAASTHDAPHPDRLSIRLRRQRLRSRIQLTDVVVVALSVCIGDLVRFGLHDSYAHSGDRDIPYAYISPAIALL